MSSLKQQHNEHIEHNQPNLLVNQPDSSVDLKLLSETASNCNTEASRNDRIASCSQLERLITALRNYELLTSSKGHEKGNTLFSDFCDEKYAMFLSDYIHFTRKHFDDVEAINEDAQNKYGLTACAVSQCNVQRREGRRRGHEGGDTDKGGSSGTKHFHGDVMANVHFLLQHLREHGLRTILTAPTKTEEHKAEDEGDDELECTDSEFAEKAAQMAQSKKVCGAELGGSSKFTIQVGDGAPEKKGKCTLMDALCAFLRAHGDQAAARGAVEIQPGDDLQCKFNQRYIECKALRSFHSNDVQQDEERLVKIRICESAHSTRFGLTSIECLIPVHRIRIGSAQAASTTCSQPEKVCTNVQNTCECATVFMRKAGGRASARDARRRALP